MTVLPPQGPEPPLPGLSPLCPYTLVYRGFKPLSELVLPVLYLLGMIIPIRTVPTLGPEPG